MQRIKKRKKDDTSKKGCTILNKQNKIDSQLHAIRVVFFTQNVLSPEVNF